MEKGKIIILNGTSSAGKTTLAKVLQERSPTPLYHMDVDMFWRMTPEKYNEKNDFSEPLKFVLKMFHAVKAFSDLGFDVVATCVFLKGMNFMEDCVGLLHDYPVLFAHVTCPLDELRRREIERGDRNVGDAESMLSEVMPENTYDIVVDTYGNSKEECADEIIKLVEKPQGFAAFKKLWKQIQP